MPTYVHGVAALQAGNTWMMRETAKLYVDSGNHSRALELLALANRTRDATLSLYATSDRVTDRTSDGGGGENGGNVGKGFFNAALPGGKRVEVRTYVDIYELNGLLGLGELLECPERFT